MTQGYTKAKEYVFEEGDSGSYFFIIEEGQVEVRKGGKVIKSLGRGDYFGDLALLYSAPRSASCYCTTHSTFWILQTRKFQEVLRTIKTNQFISNRKVLNNVKFFGNFWLLESFSVTQKNALAMDMVVEKFSEGQTIVREGDQANSFYVIKSVKVSLTSGPS